LLLSTAVVLHFPFSTFSRWLRKCSPSRDLADARTDKLPFYVESQAAIRGAPMNVDSEGQPECDKLEYFLSHVSHSETEWKALLEETETNGGRGSVGVFRGEIARVHGDRGTCRVRAKNRKDYLVTLVRNVREGDGGKGLKGAKEKLSRVFRIDLRSFLGD